MSVDGSDIGGLPHALDYAETLAEGIAGKRVVVLLDCDGSLTTIVDRPPDGVVSQVEGRSTAADFVLADTNEVERFLHGLAR